MEQRGCSVSAVPRALPCCIFSHCHHPGREKWGQTLGLVNYEVTHEQFQNQDGGKGQIARNKGLGGVRGQCREQDEFMGQQESMLCEEEVGSDNLERAGRGIRADGDRERRKRWRVRFQVLKKLSHESLAQARDMGQGWRTAIGGS